MTSRPKITACYGRPNQFNRMPAGYASELLDMPSTSLAVTDDKVWFELSDPGRERLRNLHGYGVFISVVTIGASNTAAVYVRELY